MTMKKTVITDYGITNNSQRLVKRKSVLEKYCDAGYLDLIKSNFSGEDRKKVGEKLALDYFLSGYYKISSAKIYLTNIPSTGNKGWEKALIYRERYLQAVRCVPHEFWPVVRKVCIENQELSGDNEFPKKSLLNKNSIFHQKMLLNLGLERLLHHYLKKK